MAQSDEAAHPLLVGNADLAAPRDKSLSYEPGHFGHLIADQFPQYVKFFGKPFPEVYDLIEASLSGVQSNRIAMCGDTLHTDILGAAARGWRTVLVCYRRHIQTRLDFRGPTLVPTPAEHTRLAAVAPALFRRGRRSYRQAS